MRPEKIRECFRRQPFRPLRIHLSDGAFYEIHHPDMVWIGRTDVVIGVLAEEGDDPAGLPDLAVLCDPVHVTRIVPVRQPRRRPPRGE
jgi:hypothetical protein